MMKKTILRVMALSLAALLLLLTCACADKRVAPLLTDLDFSAVDPATCQESESATDYVKLTVKITSKKAEEKTAEYEGTIIIRLFSEVAPATVANFKELVASKFYDGLTFHRVVKGFMIQGGDPKGNGTGEGPKTIPGEFNANGFENNLKHMRGVVSMARTADNYDGASCQFFIMHRANSDLDNDYATFGYVVAGMETVDEIAKVPVELSTTSSEVSSPLKTITIVSARFVQPGTN